MTLPTFSMRQLLEAGVHFGHRTRRWNPRMAPYLYGVRKNIHIIDLQQTVPMLQRAMAAVRDIVAGGGRVLFVGTKRQASEKITEAAKRCGQYYVNHRWLGGMMTNWRTISNSIKRLREVEEQLAEENVGLTKKELLRLTRERDKLDRALGGIKEMGGLPDVLFVMDTNREDIAVAEAKKLGIPVVAVVDSNSDPTAIDYPIPGNDDAIRAIHLYCDLMVGAVLDGIQAEMGATGADLGEAEHSPVEPLPAEPAEAIAEVSAETVAGEAAPSEVASEAFAAETDKVADAAQTPAEATADLAAEGPVEEAKQAESAGAAEDAEKPASEAGGVEAPEGTGHAPVEEPKQAKSVDQAEEEGDAETPRAIVGDSVEKA